MDALFSEFECTQLRGQVDVFDAIAEAEAVPAPAAAPESTDGALFALRLTDAPEGGALFGVGV